MEQTRKPVTTLIIGTPTGLGTALAEALVARGLRVAVDDPDANTITRQHEKTVTHHPNRMQEPPVDRIYEIITQPPNEGADEAVLLAEDERRARVEGAWVDVQLSARRPFQLVLVNLCAREGVGPGASIGDAPAPERTKHRAVALSLSAQLATALPGSQVLLAYVETDPPASADGTPSDYDHLIAETLELVADAQVELGDKSAYSGLTILHPPSSRPLVQRD